MGVTGDVAKRDRSLADALKERRWLERFWRILFEHPLAKGIGLALFGILGNALAGTYVLETRKQTQTRAHSSTGRTPRTVGRSGLSPRSLRLWACMPGEWHDSKRGFAGL